MSREQRAKNSERQFLHNLSSVVYDRPRQGECQICGGTGVTAVLASAGRPYGQDFETCWHCNGKRIVEEHARAVAGAN